MDTTSGDTLMAVTDEDLFGDLSTLQTIDDTLDTPIDTSIEELW